MISQSTTHRKLPERSTKQLDGPVHVPAQRRVGRTKKRKGRRQQRPSAIVLVVLFGFSFLVTRRLQIGSFSSKAAEGDVGIGRISLFNSSLPAQVLLTTMGWNHPDPSFGIKVGRTMFQAGLNQGVLDHPWYNPNGWRDSMFAGTGTWSSTQRSYVFLDVETCYEDNYPNYGWSLTANSDQEGGRPYISSSGGRIRHLKKVCSLLERLIDAPLFQNGDATLILFDCGGDGPPRWSCLNRDTNSKLNQIQASVVSESAPHTHGKRGPFDFGLPPPAIHPVPLTSAQINDILSCHNDHKQRPFLYTFTGNFRSTVRQELQKLHDPSNGIIVQHHFGGSLNISSVGRGVHKHFANVNGSYTTLLSQSEFAGVPRGDNLFSYRFTEVLSGGCIPVVYSDGWMLPFSKQLIDWHSVAVIIPERDASRTLNYLRKLTKEDRCRMRRKGYEFYRRYLATPQGVIAGIVDSLELIRLHQKNSDNDTHKTTT